MTAAAIAAQLVDIRNVGTHKVVKLTLHAPEEHAMAIMDAFGWPTMVAPVPVAVARLQQATETEPRREESASAGADKPSKSPAQIAGYLCTLPSFHKFLQEKFWDQWVENMASPDSADEEIAKQCIYDICTVTSRTQLTDKNTEWNALRIAFQLWEQHPELEDA